MDMDLEGEETDETVYLGLCPLLQTERLPQISNLSAFPFSQTQSTFMEEDSPNPFITSIDPVLASSPNLTINANPNSASQVLNSTPFIPYSSSPVGSRQGWDAIAPPSFLQNSRRGRNTVGDPDVVLSSHSNNLLGTEAGLTMMIQASDLLIGSRAGRVSSIERLQEFPELRFRRLMEVTRTNRATVTGSGTSEHDPDTSPEVLRNNILSLEASRREKLKNSNSDKKNDGACKCGADFECNICFETSVDPVVTPCGHLFCWRCLYTWISTQLRGVCECPVCKGEVTEDSVTPIYGRGGSSSAPNLGPGQVEEIPPRPSGRRADSTREVIRREREVRLCGVGPQDVERVRMDLEAVLARLRQMPRTNRASTSEVATVAPEGFIPMGFHFPAVEFQGGSGGEGRGEGDGLDSGARPSAAGELHVRRRRRYR